MKLEEAQEILNKFGYLTEEYNEEYDEVDGDYDTVKTPLYIRELLTYKKEPLTKNIDWSCKVGLTKEEQAKIEEIIPGFISAFDSEYDSTFGDGNSIEVRVKYYGEDPSWDGRDPGTFDPGWGETEIDETKTKELIDAAVKETFKYWTDDCIDDFMDKFNLEDVEDYKSRLVKIYNIIINRTGKDIID